MRIRNFIACGVLWLIFSAPALSAQPTVVEVDSVNGGGVKLASLMTIGGNAVHLASYNCLSGPPCPADGGEGLLVKKGTGCSATMGTDGGSIFYDGSGNCWYRANLNGDLRQWGITKGSVYDADATALPTLQSAQNIINTAYSVLVSIGITQLDTHQVSIYLGAPTVTAPNPVEIPLTSSLTCEATGGGPFTTGIYTGHPGTIYLRHNTYLHFQGPNDGSYLRNCIVLPEWLQTPSQATSDCSAPNDAGGSNAGVTFNYPPTPSTAYADLEAIRANMILCGDQAVFFDQVSGGYPTNIWLYGFNNPIHISKADHFYLDNAQADGNVCYYSENGGGITQLHEDVCDTLLTRNVSVNSHGDNHCVQVDSSAQSVCSSEYWQIADIERAASSNSYGRRNCQVTLVQGTPVNGWKNSMGVATPPPVSLIPPTSSSYLRGLPPSVKPSGTAGDPVNYPMWISNLNASTAAISCLGRGPFAVGNYTSGTLSSGPYSGFAYVQFDLLESEYGMGAFDQMTATATWNTCATPPCTIRIVTGNADALEVGEAVIQTDIPAKATIQMVSRNAKGPDAFDGYIAEIQINQPLLVAHNSGADTTIMISSDPNTLGAYMPSGPTASCNDATLGQCAFFNTGERVFASNSPASATYATVDTAMSKMPESNAHFYAAGYMDNGTAGEGLTDPFSFGHHFGYVVQDANSANITNKAGDENGELDDLGEALLVISGNSGQFDSVGRKNGASGLGIINDLYIVADITGTGAANTTVSAPGITSTGIGANNTGLLITVASTSAFASDQGVGVANGKGTAGICLDANWDSMNNVCLSSEEFVTYEIVNSTQLLLIARGQRFTVPQVYTAGSHVVAASISRPTTGCDTVSVTGLATTVASLNAFESIGGCLQLLAVKVPTANIAFVGHNSTLTQITGSELTGVVVGYEDATAYASMRGCGNIFAAVAQGCFGDGLASSPVTANKTLNGSAEQWLCDASAGSVVLTVPIATTGLGKYDIKKVDNSGNACVVAMSGADTIDGASSYLITAMNQNVTVINSPGTSLWYSPSQPPPLAHGQVYLSYDSANTRLQLCPKNGSGLIVNFQLLSIPSGCLYLENTSTTGSSVLNYVYAINSPISVASVSADTSGQIKVGTGAPTQFHIHDQIYATCYGILGTTEANMSGLATMKGSTTFDFISSTFTHTYTGGGTCVLLGLRARTTGHSTAANGVETETGDTTETLVGMVYVGASQALNDTATQRDVASWFNRAPKTCIQTGLTSNPTMIGSTTFVELDSSKRCEFVTWGDNDVAWSIGSRGSNANSDGAATSAGFDGTTSQPEQASMQNPSGGGSGTKHPLTVAGSASGLTENKHYITILGEAVAAGMASFDAGPTFAEARLLQ